VLFDYITPSVQDTVTAMADWTADVNDSPASKQEPQQP
jgi:hypothetical protein